MRRRILAAFKRTNYLKDDRNLSNGGGKGGICMTNENIKYESSITIYEQVANIIRDNITKGFWQEGTKIPSEKELCEYFNVSRGTIRSAITILADEGFLEKVHGKGTYVTVGKISYPFTQQLISYAESMKEKGIEFDTIVLKKEVIKPNDKIQKSLNIPYDSEVLYLKRLRLVEGQPAILLYNWISLDKCPGLDKFDFSEIGLFEAMEISINEKINYGVRNFEATNIHGEDVNLLGLNDAINPVLKIEQYTFNKNEELLEYSNAFLRTDRYNLSSRLVR